MSLLRSLPDGVLNTVAGAINAVGPVRRLISKKTINNYANATPPRPRAVSMASAYTSWPGLTDRRYSGRHLPVAAGDTAPAQPDLEAVVALFARPPGKQRLAHDTSLIFPMFAQWFVDSFLRTKWEEGTDRRFRENESNHEIDLCSIYGASEVQTDMLREGAGGRLKMREVNGEMWPAPLFEEQDGKLDIAACYRRTPERDEDHPAVPGLYTPGNFKRVFGEKWSDDDKRHAFAVGLEHGNSTLGNSVMNTLFMREHNRTAGILAKAHPGWDDEQLFQTARNVTIVVLLNIVIGDYIVHIAPIDVRLEAPPGMAEKERWYRNNWMAVEFALLYRWHDLIPDTVEFGGQTYEGTALLRANKLLMERGLGKLLTDAGRQRAGRIGLGNTASFLIARDGANVKRLSLEMARKCGLPGYNAYRVHYGMKPIATFEKLTGETEMAARLKALYGSMDKLEWFVGIFAEGYGERQMMGELLTTMVANDAFTQALTNPLLAEAIYNKDTFGPEGYQIVTTTRTLAEVIVRNTEVTDPKSVDFTVPVA